MKRTIEIIVLPAGDITIDAVGFKRADCRQVTRFLEAKLGQVGQKIKKPKFHQSARRTHRQKLGG